MHSNLDRVKNKILNKELAIGTAVTLANPVIPEIYSNCGFDFIWIDTEHSPIDVINLDLIIMTIRNTGMAPFVRVPGADPLQLKKVLDMGPAGIIFPQLRNIEEIKYAVSCCKYPPDGIRGYGPRRPVNYGIMNYNEYSKLSDSEPWIIIQIENIDVVNNLKEVLKIKGVDSVAVGPSDLSFSIGFPNNITHPDVLKAFDYIGKICRESNVPLGIPIGTADVEDVKLWLKRGVSWIQGDGDGSHILSGGMNSYNIIKKAYEEVKNKS